jgi:DnaD/phage-associated family protein
MSADRFEGFPGSGAATAIPNVFFARVLPELSDADAMLAFLWVSKLAQAMRGEVRCITADDIWADDGAAAAFERLGSGRPGIADGLAACEKARALVSVEGAGPGGRTLHYFVNNPPSRKVIGRVLAGQLQLPGAGAVPAASPRAASPLVFRLYEEHFGTITPFVGERLMDVAARYPDAWIEDAVREAALVQARNWRYVERILERWTQEGRIHETPGRGSLEEQKQRYLGGRYGHIARSN